MALAVRIASPQGVAFHTSTDAAPAERGARRPSLRRKEPRGGLHAGNNVETEFEKKNIFKNGEPNSLL
jgi:hypothetical protein